MTYVKANRSFTVFLFLILTNLLPISSSFAKMQAAQTVLASDVTNHYKSGLAKGKLTAEEVEIARLANIAVEVFGIKEFYTSGYNSTKVESIKAVYLNNVASSIEQIIQQKENWNDTLPSSKMNRLKKEATLFKKALGENSVGWAWYLQQRGSKKEAQVILSQGFERSYGDAMKLTELTGFKGSNPSNTAEVFSKFLTPFSSESENKDREEKIRKMRVHISNLPNMQMMT